MSPERALSHLSLRRRTVCVWSMDADSVWENGEDRRETEAVQ